jgi:hypothetical protein
MVVLPTIIIALERQKQVLLPLKTFKYTLSTLLPINNRLANDANGGEVTRSNVSFTSKFSPNFNMKNMISTYYTSDFSWKKKRPKFAKFQRKKNPNCQIFYDKF